MFTMFTPVNDIAVTKSREPTGGRKFPMAQPGACRTAFFPEIAAN